MSTQALATKKYYTPQEYLDMEETADNKHEFHQGEIFAMAGGTQNHARIALDLGTSINLALRGSNCEAYPSDMKLFIKAQNLFTYPDLMIVCGKAEFYENRNDVITNPLVIFEVLSSSTKNYDRGEKFEYYRSISSFQEYILIDQYRIHVEQMYLDTPNKWILSEYNQIADTLKLAKVNIQIPLEELYRRVEFAE